MRRGEDGCLEKQSSPCWLLRRPPDIQRVSTQHSAVILLPSSLPGFGQPRAPPGAPLCVTAACLSH